MSYKLVIFDMDGTILDTIDDLADSLNYILKMNDMPTHSVEEVKSFVGNGIRVLIDKAVPIGTSADVKEKLFSDFVPYYKAHSAVKTRPYEGINEAIAELKSKGYLTAVVSNKRHEAVKSLCKEFFNGCFDSEFGEQDGINKKPAPDLVNMVLSELNVVREEAVYIGDSEVDLLTAANSEMDCIAVSWGFRGKDVLKSLGAERIADTTSEMLDFIYK